MVQNTPTTVVKLDNTTDLQAVLLNYDDYAFCKILVDPLTIQYLQDKLHLVTPVVNQKVFTRALFEMVKDGRMTANQYLKVI